MHKLANFYKPYLAGIIEKHRKELNMSQKEFAEKLGISERYYHDLKYGISMLSTVELILFFGLLTEKEILDIIKSFRALIDSEEYQANLVKIDFI